MYSPTPTYFILYVLISRLTLLDALEDALEILEAELLLDIYLLDQSVQMNDCKENEKHSTPISGLLRHCFR